MSRYQNSMIVPSHRELPFQTTKRFEFLEQKNALKRLDIQTNTLGKWDNLIARTELTSPTMTMLHSPRNQESKQACRTIIPSSRDVLILNIQNNYNK